MKTSSSQWTDYLSPACDALYYVAYPIFYILKLILYVLATIAAPVFHLGSYCLYACWYALGALGKFETLYIFFGVAALVGIVTGTSLHYVSGFIVSMLNLETSPEEQRGRTLASYRAEKHERRYANDSMTTVVHNDRSRQRNELRLWEDRMSWSVSNREQGRAGSRVNTILEEEDSSDGF